jgi:glycosyltransferase involved in cell wall biosynthesis
VIYSDNKAIRPDIVFIVGGTKKIGWLLKMKFKGVKIIYRLDGINWLHKKQEFKLKNYFINEYRNFNNKIIHALLADFIVFQSDFSKKWWENSGWNKNKKNVIIYNGVDINEFTPEKSNELQLKLVCLEGTIDYTPYAISLLNNLSIDLKNIPLCAYGSFERQQNLAQLEKDIFYYGKIERSEVAKVFQRNIYLSLDINPACPNTVIEAMACGCPVIGFDTGALKELIKNDSGIVVPYEGNPWELDTPNFNLIADAILKIKNNYEYYSNNARNLALSEFDFNNISKKYVEILKRNIKK